jgi:Uma2 family endonuclease
VWDRLTPEERARIVESLPSEFPVNELMPPEGTPHFTAKVRASDALGGFFSRLGRKVFLACELPVYYPGESMFAPDLIAVMDVETHDRQSWVVSHEGRGVDLALEVTVAGDRRKDAERNVERYARLGVREYFIFDRGRMRLQGWRLAEGGRRTYVPILPQQGFYTSQVLGLQLQLEGERLRFYYSGAPVPESQELIATLQRLVEEAELHREQEAQRREEEEQLREEEERLREEEVHRREEAERRLAEEERLREEAEHRLAQALAELERLRGGKS